MEYEGDGKTTKKNRDYRKNKSMKRYHYRGTSNNADSGDTTVFDSGMTVMQDVDVLVPDKVRDICISIQEEVGRPEWGALFKGEWTQDGFKVRPEYVIPEQTVSRSHIDYDEDLKKFRDDGYTVNVHSHPFSGRSAGFSGTDDEHINSHFELALLYAGKAKDIVDGILNIEVKDGIKVQTDVNVEVNRDRDSLPDVDIDNIQKRSRGTGKGSTSSGSSKSKKYKGGAGTIVKSLDSESYQKDDSEMETGIKVPESNVTGTAKDYEDVDGIEVIPENPEENPEEEEKEESNP